MSELVLGIDVGTRSTKGLLATLDGTILRTAVREHGLDLPRPGWAEHDAEAVWWGDVRALARELLDDGLGDAARSRLAAVCVSGVGPCVLLAGADGAPLRPAILYGIDTRAGAQIAALEDQLGAETILRRCGSPLTSQAAGPKLRWIADEEPDVLARARFLLMPSSLAVARLTGEYVLDHHSASQCDPLYDLGRHEWIEEWAAVVCPGLPLPRLLWPGEVAGTVTAAGERETSIPAGVPVCTGTIDAWAEAVSVNVEQPGDLMLMYGTTMFLVAPADAVHAVPGLWATEGTVPGRPTIAGGMATSGALTDWLRDIAGGVAFETLLAEAGATPPGADGLVALPYFAGERTPLFDPDARGAIFGLTLRHGRGHLYRALLEATAYGIRHNLEAFAAAGVVVQRIVAVGGGTRGGLWMQIVSDVTGLEQEVPGQTIGAALGDARLAAMAVGATGAGWNDPVARVVPDPARADRYATQYGVYRTLHAATIDQAHVLAGLVA